MSDNLCGPSTALKSFSEHVNRDRSVHQDRAAPGRAGPSNFRSAPNGTHSNEAEARAFAAGGAAFQADPMMGPDMAMNGQMHPHPHPHPAQFQQMGPRFAGPGHVVNAGANNWAAEFASTNNAGPAAAAPSLAGIAPAHASPFAPQQAVNRLQHFSSGMMAQSPSFLPSYNQPNFASPQAFSPLAPHSSSSFTPTVNMPHIPAPQFQTDNPPLINNALANAPSGVGSLTEAELEARFAAFDTVEDDFEAEMGTWMQEHGPTAEAQAETATQQEDVDTILERMADELDAQRLDEAQAVTDDSIAQEAAEEAEREALAKDQDDLARTAGQIVSTLDSNSRFQGSSFLRLMRRIQDREVTVQGDALVDGAGQPIEAEPATAAPATTTTTTDAAAEGADQAQA